MNIDNALNKANAQWLRYLTTSLKERLSDPFFKKELRELRRTVEELRVKKFDDKYIASDLYFYYLWDWKVPPYYSQAILRVIEEGRLYMKLDESPIKIITHRMHKVHPATNPKAAYEKRFGVNKDSLDNRILVQMEDGVTSKDVAKFNSIYFNDVIDPILNIQVFANVGKRTKLPDMKVRFVVAECLSRGEDDAAIAAELDKKAPKNTVDGWTVDAVRLIRQRIEKLHDRNPNYWHED